MRDRGIFGETANPRCCAPPLNRLRGIVFVELIVGLVVIALVMLAVASVLFAVAQGWKDQDVSQSTQMQADQVYTRVQSRLSAAKCVGPYDAGSPSGGGYIIFWRADDDSYADGQIDEGDGQIEKGEVALIVQTNHSLYLYSSAPPYSGQAAGHLAASDLAALTPATIESWSFMQPTLLGGPGSQTDDGTMLDVEGLQVYVTPSAASQLPIVEFMLTFSKSGQSLTLYNSTTLRPSAQPQ
jgi:type II secretory pathway pseudopilin PulG